MTKRKQLKPSHFQLIYDIFCYRFRNDRLDKDLYKPLSIKIYNTINYNIIAEELRKGKYT